MAQNFADDYRRIDSLLEKGLTRSALDVADDLYTRAAADERADHLARALEYRSRLVRNLEEDGDQAALATLRSALANHGDLPVFATLTNLLLGEFYHNYAEQNSYRLSELSTAGENPVPDSLDLTAYGMEELLFLSRRHLYRSLELARENQTPLVSIPALVAGNMSRTNEVPTLYDLIVDRALTVLGSSLGTLTDQAIANDSLALLPAEAFAAQDLSLNFDLSKGTPRKLQVYQQWIAYHLDAGGPALLYADLERMRFVHRNGVADSIYFTALERMYANYPGVEERDRILVEMASVLNRDDDQLGPRPRVRALALLDRVGEADSVAVVLSEQLRAAITRPALDARALSFYPRSEHLLVGLEYRNVERVFYRLYTYDPAAATGRNSYRASERLDIIKQGQLAASGSQRLAPNDDYSRHTTELDLDPLPAGGYQLVISTDPSFTTDAGIFSVIPFQVSDLAVLHFETPGGNFVQVTDRTSGEPVAGVTVALRLADRRSEYKPAGTRTSDGRGTFQLPGGDDYRNYQLVLEHGKDRLVTELYSYDRRSEPGRETRYTTLLTDRPLYRPGQTVHVYGLRYRTDGDELPSILPDDRVTVILRDANYQEVARREVMSDAYGRFSLDFTLPDGGLTGEFSLQTDNGGTSLRVEEYKRPRFSVELTAPDAVASGRPVAVSGTALTYAGPPVSEGQVSYRVYLEEVRWFFSRYGGGGDGGGRELLSSGTTETDASGTFAFTFTGSEQATATGFRRYRYVVEADVTDPTGETHQATTTVGLQRQRPAVAITPQRESVDRGDSLTLLAVSDDPEARLELRLRIVPVTKPNAALLEREWDMPDRPVINRAAFARNFPNLAYAPVPELAAWPAAGDPVYETTVSLSGNERRLPLAADFPVGYYRIEFTYPDGTAGEPATFSVYSTAAAELPAGELYRLDGIPDSVVVGQPLELTLLSAVDLPLVHYQWQSRSGATTGRENGGRVLTFSYTPTEADRGGLSFALATVRLNRIITESRQLSLPWNNKELSVTYETFRDRLRPGTPEEWTVIIRNRDGSPVEAAALATMYDASLDQLYAGRGWEFSPYPLFYGGGALVIGNSFGTARGYTFDLTRTAATDTVPDLPRLLLPSPDEARVYKSMPVSMRGRIRLQSAPVLEESVEMEMVAEDASAGNAAPPPPPAAGSPGAQEPIDIRTNLRETAFWLPTLTADADGSLRISFTSPEALTAWKFRLFTHDKGLNYTVSEREIVTQKELMVLPSVPRFVRAGDDLTLTARVSNMTAAELPVDVRLELFDPATDSLLAFSAFGGDAGAGDPTVKRTLAAQGSETVRFSLVIPEDMARRGMLGYRIVARGGAYSDGEENILPVLTDRTLVTVARPFYLKRGERKTLTLPLLAGYDSRTLEQVGYVFEATTNPAWLALKALPYLMESDNESTEQLANRYFANQLAYATVSGKPVLEEVFRKWQADSTALLSELERNEALTNALITETPWVREAQSEAEQRARIGELFDLKRLADEQQATLAKLAARQESDGAYSWFPGGRSDRYMTQYVVETLARLQQLGVTADAQSATVDQIRFQAISYLDAQLADDYRRLFADVPDSLEMRNDYRPSALQVHYLYARAVSVGMDAPESEALTYFRERAFATWTEYGLYEQALIALTAHAAGDASASAILKSLRERALHSDELGMYWKYAAGYRWNNLPIETHTRLLEAFRTIDPVQEELDEMRLWLLTNKRTNRWATTKATAAAVYALLSGGKSYTVERAARPLEASWPGLRGNDLDTRVRALQEDAEAATGAFTLRLPAAEVNRDLATVRLRNRGNDLVWGGVYWQYTEVAAKVEASNDGPLTLQRQLFRRTGDQLIALEEGATLAPGDRITVRLTVSTDREMDYVHVKDRRAAAFEPVEALSGYTYDNGLGYYFAPGDLATNFFIDHLPKGTYTLEYDLFTTFAGNFSSGLGRVECMYAPEFGGNTAGGRVVVR